MDKNKLILCCIVVFLLVFFSGIVYAQTNNRCCPVVKKCPDGSEPRIYLIIVDGFQGLPTKITIDHANEFLKEFKIKNLHKFFIPYSDSDPNLVLTKTRKALEGLKKLSRECDTIIFIYSGHGDAKGIYPLGLDAEPISDYRLINFAKNTKGKKIIILDSCGSGALGEKIFKTDKENTIIITSTKGAEKCFYSTSVTTLAQAFFPLLKANDCRFDAIQNYAMFIGGRFYPDRFTEMKLPCCKK